MSPGDNTEGDADQTRPISVAELLARNGTIGAPPVRANRRRRRGNAKAVSVSELTGEIPVVEDLDDEGEDFEEGDFEEGDFEEGDFEEDEAGAVDEPPDVVADETSATTVITSTPGPSADATMVVVYASEVAASEIAASEPAVVEAEVEIAAEPESEPEPEPESLLEAEPEPGPEPGPAPEPEAESESEAPVEEPEPEVAVEEPVSEVTPPLSADPHPRKAAGPTRGHDPRPLRRNRGAEQMTYDPVDQSVDLTDLVAEHDEDVEQLRSYLKSSGGPLFSGETVADDLARRGVEESGEVVAEAAEAAAPAVRRVKGGKLAALRNAVVAVLQSVLAVVFGAGLFIAFDQLWRWNNIVALVLSVLVILGLVVAVRVVRKTEDIASTLIAVAVGALVTLGPLALLQST